MAASAYSVLVLLLTCMPAVSQSNPLGQFERSADIGSPQLTGSAKYDADTQQYTLSGAGTNMWFGRDQFHFLSRRIKGDLILRTRIEFIGTGAVNHRKVG